MKKTFLLNCSIALLSASFSFSSHAESLKLDRECQSLGLYEGSMVYLNLYKTKTTYTAIFKKSSNTAPFLTIDGITKGRTQFSGAPALINNKAGFEFTSDSQFPANYYEASWVDFTYKGKKKHIALSCNHAK